VRVRSPQLKKVTPLEIGDRQLNDLILVRDVSRSRRGRRSNAEPMSSESFPIRRALAVEIHEDWIEGPRYLNMETLREQRKQLQLLEAA
jgi:hypothetical protein